MCTQFQLNMPSRISYFERFGATNCGNVLLSMSVDDFCAWFGDHSGDTLHAQLQLWKTGKKLQKQNFVLLNFF